MRLSLVNLYKLLKQYLCNIFNFKIKLFKNKNQDFINIIL